MNVQLAAREATRSPSPAAIHADTVACHAARKARVNGADTVECAQVYATVYAATLGH